MSTTWLHKEQAQLCPGGVCEIEPAAGAGGNRTQGLVVLAFVALMGAWATYVAGHDPYLRAPDPALAAATAQTPMDPAEAARCKVPEFARALGHEEKWKLHNNCK